MADVAKQYLDLTGLQAYDGLIKAWANGSNQIAYKKVVKSADGNNILFFKNPNAVVGTDTPDATIALGNADMQAQLDALAAIAGAVWDGTNEVYTLALDATFDSNTDTILEALNELKGQINVLNGADTVTGSVAKSIKDAVEALDTTTDVGIASVASNVVTIKGSISETDGIIGAGSASDIVLEEVAYTGAAADVSTDAIDDGELTPTQLYAAGTVQGILEAIARDLNDLESESVVTVEKQTTAETGYFASYQVKQNGVQVGDTINIPKDYLVKSATVETVTTADDPYTGAEVGDKYIDFVVNVYEGTATDEHIYLPLDDLMAAITGGTTAEATVSIDSHNVITVTIVKIAASKIAYSNTTSGSAVEETVQAALARIDGDNTTAGSIKKAVKDAVEALDTTADVGIVSVDTTNNTFTITGSVAESDGIIATGSADTVTVGSIETASINALFA